MFCCFLKKKDYFTNKARTLKTNFWDKNFVRQKIDDKIFEKKNFEQKLFVNRI